MRSPNKLTISLSSGSGPSSRHVFEADRSLVVGKATDCGLKIDAKGVSRKHCQLEATRQGWTIIDLGSTNGIIVNGKAFAGTSLPAMTQPIPLCDGDEIGIGEAVLRMHIETEREEHTEILVPQRFANDGGAHTEVLIPGRSLHEIRDNKPAARGNDSAKTPRSTQQTSTNPMNRPKTVLVSPPKEAKPTQAQSSDRLLGKAGSDDGSLPSPFAFKVPGDFRKYRLEKRVGVGGMGEVFLAKELAFPSQEWAIKFLKPQADFSEMDRARFLREMEIAMNMQNMALIRCVDCGDEDGQLFIVMDYCNGGNLHELLKRSGKLTVRRALRLMNRLLAGVDFAHVLGIVHRDLKPSNILLHKDAAGKYAPKISDFGLAKSYMQAGESGMTVNGSVGGSWAYMPKEQLTNFRFVSPQSDVWSLGAILYECLTLKLPRPMEKGCDPIRTILESKIVPIQEIASDLHPELTKFVMKCLARETEDRFMDAGAMRNALKLTAMKAGIEL